jgi:peptide/nickel transport system permease protein
VFSWPGTASCSTPRSSARPAAAAGTILVLALFFVLLNLVVDVVQSTLDPRIQRG